MRVFSFGGGVQSTASLVLAAQGKIQVDAFIFADVGEDSESPETIEYVSKVSAPFAREHGIRLETVRHTNRRGVETLYQHIYREDRHGVPIPAKIYTPEGKGSIAPRICTHDWKIVPVSRWVLSKDRIGPHEMLLGISTDEWKRMSNRQYDPRVFLRYPLIDLGISRADCEGIIRDAGLPDCPSSACWFCPHRKMQWWKKLEKNNPEMFNRAAHLEFRLTERVEHRGYTAYLTNARKPLAEAVKEDKEGEDTCESGYCFT